ncbi:MAG: hypothetical protein ACREJ2_03825 [Planctomycetota bacterium]
MRGSLTAGLLLFMGVVVAVLIVWSVRVNSPVQAADAGSAAPLATGPTPRSTVSAALPTAPQPTPPRQNGLVNHVAVSLPPPPAPRPTREPVQTAPDLTPPVPAPQSHGPLVWKNAFTQHFDTADSLKDFLQMDGGELLWSDRFKALYLKNDSAQGQIYAAVHRSLPGDLRLRMRVLRTREARDINIGIVFSVKGSLHAEDGYFAEWKRGQVQIKRNDVFEAGGEAPTPSTPDRWVTVELDKVGGVIRMFEEGKQVLEWTDPEPYTGAEHDLLSLYVWSERTMVDDLTIDRNANDAAEPLPDDPADPINAVDGARGPGNPTPDQF